MYSIFVWPAESYANPLYPELYIQCANQNMPQNELNEVAHHYKRLWLQVFLYLQTDLL